MCSLPCGGDPNVAYSVALFSATAMLYGSNMSLLCGVKQPPSITEGGFALSFSNTSTDNNINTLIYYTYFVLTLAFVCVTIHTG